MKLPCECGCNVEDYMSRLKTVEIEQALDESLRQTVVAKRFLVRAECYEPFIRELQAKTVLEGIVRRYKVGRSGFLRRLMRVRGVIRLQYAINIRNKGIERTKRLSVRSGIMFLCSHRLAGWLDQYWRWKDQRKSRNAMAEHAAQSKLVRIK